MALVVKNIWGSGIFGISRSTPLAPHSVLDRTLVYAVECPIQNCQNLALMYGRFFGGFCPHYWPDIDKLKERPHKGSDMNVGEKCTHKQNYIKKTAVINSKQVRSPPPHYHSLEPLHLTLQPAQSQLFQSEPLFDGVPSQPHTVHWTIDERLQRLKLNTRRVWWVRWWVVKIL